MLYYDPLFLAERPTLSEHSRVLLLSLLVCPYGHPLQLIETLDYGFIPSFLCFPSLLKGFREAQWIAHTENPGTSGV
jgi:hypothetical protein